MNFQNIKLPQQITPCPITEAVVEIRFESKIPGEVIPGLLFTKFGTALRDMQKLPILDLPSSLIEHDPNLRFSPQYKATMGDYVIQFGPRCVSVACVGEYKGWSDFSAKIQVVFSGIFELGIIDKSLRLGVRYISFLNNMDIFPNLSIDLNVAGNSLIGQSNIIRSEFEIETFKCALQIANTSIANFQQGSSIDIDILTVDSAEITSNYSSLIDNAHTLEKKIFFNLLKDDFLKSLKPVY